MTLGYLTDKNRISIILFDILNTDILNILHPGSGNKPACFQPSLWKRNKQNLKTPLTKPDFGQIGVAATSIDWLSPSWNED